MTRSSRSRFVRRGGGLLPVGVALGVSLGACGGGGEARTPAPTSPTGPLVARPPDAGTPGAETVATVDGRAITVADVARQARAAGQTPRAALDSLVEAELLAGEAARRGLAVDRDVREAGDAAAVRRYLASSFERDVTPAQIPEEELRRLYQRNLPHFDHPDARDIWHIVALTSKSDGPDRRDALRRRAEQVHAAALRARSLDEFKALATSLTTDDVPLRLEEIYTIPGPYVKEFVDAAFAIPRPGAVSPVVETRFGWHVLYYAAAIPAEHVPFERAEAALRDGDWPEFRKRAFARWLDALVGNHHVEVFPGRLDEKAAP